MALKLEAVTDKLAVGICVWQLVERGNPASLILRVCNESAARFLSVDTAAVLDRPIAEGFPGSLDTPLPGIFAQVIERGEMADLGDVPYQDEIVPDGVFSIRVWPTTRDHAIVEFTNVTDERRAQAKVEARTRELEAKHQQLLETQAQMVAQAKLASFGALVAGIAHELKNPLNFVVNLAKLSTQRILDLRGLMSQDTGGGDIERNLELLSLNNEKIISHGQRVNQLLSSMLMHARGSSATRELVDLNKLVADAVTLARASTGGRAQGFALAVEERYDREIGEVLVATSDISRVLINLLNNARYSLEAKSCVESSATFDARLLISTHRDEDQVEIRVRDNGQGIAREILDDIWKPFYTTKPPGLGSGLGLSLSHDIIGAHGGQLRVDSREGEFAEFIVILPRDRTQAQEAARGKQ